MRNLPSITRNVHAGLRFTILVALPLCLVLTPPDSIAKPYTPTELGDPDADTGPNPGPSKGASLSSSKLATTSVEFESAARGVVIRRGSPKVISLVIGKYRFLLLSIGGSYSTLVTLVRE